MIKMKSILFFVRPRTILIFQRIYTIINSIIIVTSFIRRLFSPKYMKLRVMGIT